VVSTQSTTRYCVVIFFFFFFLQGIPALKFAFRVSGEPASSDGEKKKKHWDLHNIFTITAWRMQSRRFMQKKRAL
jgi:hypothetical protein